MVRQDQLEQLLAESIAPEEARAVVRFIDNFTGLLKENLNAENQANKDEAEGITPSTAGADSQYMHLSADLDDPAELGSAA